jgi:hypothetical protein
MSEQETTTTMTQGPVRMSATIAKIAAALSKAQGALRPAIKDASNPHFKSRYADLASTWDACREALSSHGLSVLQPASASGRNVTVTTMLAHESGEWLACDLTLTAQQDTPQAVGSAVSYGRRYGLQSMVGIAAEDDDGNAASGKGDQRSPSKPTSGPPAAEYRREVERLIGQISDPSKAHRAGEKLASIGDDVRALADFRDKVRSVVHSQANGSAAA